MEKVYLLDPLCGDSRADLNLLFEKGYSTMNCMGLEGIEWPEQQLLLFHLRICRCPQCRFNRGELDELPEGFEPDDDDDGPHWNPGNN